jgi:cytochrome c oxidase cbb3-type subunit III
MYSASVKALGPFLTLVATAAMLAQDNAKSNPFASDPQAAEAGRGIFRIYCSPCHGIKAEGGRGPDLTRGVYAAGEKDADLYRVISEGSPATEMPSFSSSIGEEGIWRLVSYIRSAARKDREAPAGDRAAGETLFWGKAGCGGCHRAGVRGGRVGPDLSLAGRSRSLKYLRESVVDPNADISPGYATIEVVTRAGKKIIGVQRGYDNFSAQLMDLQENYYSFLKSDVQSLKREMKSLMPSYSKLPPREIDDLVAYLQSLGRKESR